MKSENKIDKIPNKLWGFYMYFLKPVKWLVASAVLLSFMSRVMGDFLKPYSIKNVISVVTDGSAINSNVLNAVLVGLVIFAVIAYFEDLCMISQALIAKRFQPVTRARINVEMLRYVHEHSYKYFSNNFAGSLSNKISDLSGRFFHIYSNIVYTLMPAVINLSINLVFFTIMNPLLGGVMFIWLLLHISYMSFRTPIMRKYSKIYSEEKSSIIGKIVDSLSNFMIVKLNSKQKFEYESLREKHKKEVIANKNSWTAVQKSWMPLVILSSSFNIALMFSVFYLYSKGKIDISDISYIIMVLRGIFNNVWNLNDALMNFVEDTSTMRQALDTLLVPIEIEDVKGAKDLVVKKGDIQLDNISFHYNRGKSVLKDFNLHIKSGEKVGIVGPSGAGKTTLVNLLVRMFDVQKGEILIDGQNIAKVTQNSLRENISVVTQDSTLFHRTLRENIGYTKDKATDKEIIEASKKAGAHDFIKGLSKKYDTLVGERGIKLSGGQRQRVNIARTILKNAPILILDEATSALDSETEAYIQKTFKEIMKGKTTLAIAHRLSTLKLMDRIVVVSQGQIVEEGTHRQLIAKKGVYSKLWSLQSSDFIENEDM